MSIIVTDKNILEVLDSVKGWCDLEYITGGKELRRHVGAVSDYIGDLIAHMTPEETNEDREIMAGELKWEQESER